MIDLAQLTGFDWDDGNSAKSISKHRVLSTEAEQVFVDERLLIAADVKHSDDEVRYHALGRTVARRLLHVTFTIRGDETKIRVISARDANRKERASYE